MMDKNELEIDGVKYVREDSIKSTQPATCKKGLSYKIVRTYSAGVFAGWLKKRVGKEATLVDVRRVWYWSGANSLSQLAMEGTKNPGDCKFAMAVDEIELTEVIEVLCVTKKAQDSILGVAEWKK